MRRCLVNTARGACWRIQLAALLGQPRPRVLYKPASKSNQRWAVTAGWALPQQRLPRHVTAHRFPERGRLARVLHTLYFSMQRERRSCQVWHSCLYAAGTESARRRERTSTQSCGLVAYRWQSQNSGRGLYARVRARLTAPTTQGPNVQLLTKCPS